MFRVSSFVSHLREIGLKGLAFILAKLRRVPSKKGQADIQPTLQDPPGPSATLRAADKSTARGSSKRRRCRSVGVTGCRGGDTSRNFSHFRAALSSSVINDDCFAPSRSASRTELLWMEITFSSDSTCCGSEQISPARRDRLRTWRRFPNLPYRRLPSRQGVEFYGGPDIDSDSQVWKPAIQQV